jgi:hypothetical protein
MTTGSPPPDDQDPVFRSHPKITFSAAHVTAASGKASAAILVLCFVLASVLIPVAAHLPHWIEFEIVFGVWWVIWSISLAVLLYRGSGLADDAAAPSLRWSGSEVSGQDIGCATRGLGHGCTAMDGSGCGEAIAGLALLVVVIIGIWVMIEIVFPAIAFGLYLAIRGMLARVVNERPECKGNVLRSLAHGVLWATVYTAPLALIVWTFHAVHPHARL